MANRIRKWWRGEYGELPWQTLPVVVILVWSLLIALILDARGG